jgi:hypothetical protein
VKHILIFLSLFLFSLTIYFCSSSCDGGYSTTSTTTDNDSTTDIDQSDKIPKVHHILFYGQSLSTGWKGLPILTTQSSPNTYTFSGGVRSGTNQLKYLIPLIENSNYFGEPSDQAGETPASGAVEEIINLIPPVVQQKTISKILVSVAGENGQSITSLSKGSPYFERLQAQIESGFNLTNDQSNDYQLGSLFWIQGEADADNQNITKESYKSKLIQLHTQVKTIYSNLLQSRVELPLLLSQVAHKQAIDQKISQSQWEVAKENQEIYFVTPIYFLPHNTDGVHLTNVGYKWLGAYFGRAYYQIVINDQKIKPLVPIQAIAKNKQLIEIRYNVPVQPLVFDMITISQTTNFGYSIDYTDSTTVIDPIRSVNIIGGDRVEISFRSGFEIQEGMRLRYALDYRASGTYIEGGATGNLRDSAGTDTFISIQENHYALHNWSISFDIPIDNILSNSTNDTLK